MRRNSGLYGEYLTYKKLARLDGNKRFLFYCYIPKDDGTTLDVDVILMHPSGIYVFESKNYSGWIFGTETQKMWAQTFPNGRKEKFYNPIMQNSTHIKWLMSALPDIDKNACETAWRLFEDKYCNRAQICVTIRCITTPHC